MSVPVFTFTLLPPPGLAVGSAPIRQSYAQHWEYGAQKETVSGSSWLDKERHGSRPQKISQSEGKTEHILIH